MERPFKDDRPLGPFAQLGGGGECILRMSTIINYNSPPTEVKQSLEKSIVKEVGTAPGGLGMEVDVDNITFTSGDRHMEVRMDLPVKETNKDLEEEIVKSIGIAISDAGAERVSVKDVKYSVVSR